MSRNEHAYAVLKTQHAAMRQEIELYLLELEAWVGKLYTEAEFFDVLERRAVAMSTLLARIDARKRGER
jgi:hypothetical protein